MRDFLPLAGCLTIAGRNVLYIVLLWTLSSTQFSFLSHMLEDSVYCRGKKRAAKEEMKKEKEKVLKERPLVSRVRFSRRLKTVSPPPLHSPSPFPISSSDL